jgi:murein DD-endopeptidase MepM/ murein hydrolase activator NlpD
VTSYSDRYRTKKPIRKDRVLIAAFFVLAVILLPLLVRSGCSRRNDPLTIIDNGTIAGPDDGTPIATDDDIPLDVFPIATNGSTTLLPAIEDRILRHSVSDGETVNGVASELGVGVSNLLASNRLFGGGQLQPGQVLYASQEGVVHTIQPGQTLTDISLTYGVPVETLTSVNGITRSSTIYAGDRILIPDVTSTFWDDVVRLSNGVSSRFIWPLEGEVVSTFGWRVHPVLEYRHHHDGIDIDVPEGTIVRAAAGGEVYFYGEQPGYGNVLVIEHGDGYFTMYGHLSSAIVSPGRYVEIGQEIAVSGNTGISSGPHLHFEIRNGEFPIDPLRYLP